ncbi:MAG: energy transducer TonB [Terriglobales bacterium]
MNRIQVFVAVLQLAIFSSPPSVAQVQASDSASGGVAVLELAPPVYPPLARQARMSGEVKIELAIRPDGRLESAKSISGDPILVPSALESARQSRFECRGCSKTNAYSMTYTFQVLGDLNRCCCTQGASTDSTPGRYGVSQSQGHVTITVAPGCICPDACAHDWAREHSRVRSAKCFYMWKCGDAHISIQ